MGFVANGKLDIETSLGAELFDMMKDGNRLGGCPCVVTGYSNVAIGNGEQMIRKALIIEPIEI